ncbi:hypothetical protein [Sphingomonas sp. 179-A 2A2 NHS]|uniref:hypothetical protein n=1 Tax=Sphingomonas sp. 179-A 2A2 NHS TaxID=3374290 RepID=UPI0038792C5C
MNGISGDDADRLARLDDFVIEEILAADDAAVDDGARDRILASFERAELALRKARLVELRAQIDRERAGATVVTFDADRMRAKLKEAANDPDVKMTLAARGGVSDGDEDMEGLLEDLAELERDAGDDTEE